MSKIRDKLRALHAPRPTELPEGIEVAPMLAPGSAPPQPEQPPDRTGNAESATTPRSKRPAKKPAKPTAPTNERGQHAARTPGPADRPKQTQPSPGPPERAPAPSRPTPQPTTPPRSERAADALRQPPAERDIELDGPSSLPPRFAAAERSASTSVDPDRSPIPHRNTLPRTDRVVVRRSEFERWRRKRRGEVLDEESRDVTPALYERPPAPVHEGRASAGAPDSGDRLVLERGPAGPVSAHDHLMAAKIAWSANRVAKTVGLLERALDLGLESRQRYAALRTLAEAYISLEQDEDARIALEELVEVESADPFPFVVLADLVAPEDPARAEALRTRAKAIAPWMG